MKDFMSKVAVITGPDPGWAAIWQYCWQSLVAML